VSAGGPTKEKHHVIVDRGAPGGQRTVPGHVGVLSMVQQGLLHAHMRPVLQPFTRALRLMRALNEVDPNEPCRLFYLDPAVSSFLFND